jgi:endonuclease-3
MDKKEKAKKILDILENEFPDAKIALKFSNPLELLVATILSAQCTDERVNITTKSLFKKYRTTRAYASADRAGFEKDIRSINFYRNKTRSIQNCSKKLIEDFGGKLPETVEELTTLPGVGRKTANIVLASAFGKDALAVDTHVKRVSNRLGLAASDDPDEIERELCSIIPKKRWAKTTLLFILHGRKTCKAKNPLCETCPLRDFSVYYKTVRKGQR